MKRELKLRQLAKPLKEARKDPRVDKAVLFVEGLFGEKMRGNPYILVINGTNREEYLKAVKSDAEHLDNDIIEPRKPLVFNFLPFVLSEREVRKIYPDAKLISPWDLMRPIKFFRENIKINRPTSTSMKEIAGNKQSWFERPFVGKTFGVYLPLKEDHSIIAIKEEGILGLVHELIHAEDHKILDRSNPLYSVITEGRSTFGGGLFIAQEDGIDTYKIDTLRLLKVAKEQSLFGDGGILRKHVNGLKSSPAAMKDIGIIKTLKTWANKFWNDVKDINWNFQKYYVPFMIAIAELAHILNDPYAAFRITTEKQPRTVEDIKNIREFYKKEIEEYGKKN